MDASQMGHMGHTGSGAFSEFAALWSPGWILVVIIVGWLYAMAVGRWRQQFEESSPVGIGKQLYFYIGLLLFYVAEGSPLYYYGHHYSFSAHMLQQSISYLVMPPLLLLGLPGWLLRPALRIKAIHLLMKGFASPVISLFLFNLIFSLYHIPVIMDYLMANPLMHTLYSIIFMLAAFQMWFPVFCPLPEYNRMNELRRMAYIFVNGILLTPACALIIFAEEPIYASYKGISEQFLFMSVLNDQQLGGVVMKIIQEIVYAIALGYTFFRWYRKERKQEEEEELALEGYVQPHPNMNQA
ncbi:cytochrome C oxidase assembly protein [Paenibacillus sp. LMG 31456]|uniref:Cytochrome C oxidase assembly protein n=1 Tax=Paenibacillus foliorum TaxID=2654974 RepID=A0A972GZS3_9BACL|nr:cytochrome c oxidase assembly protein [Paenibacillus foliorum]NOU93571.1 cytochrome C oxidase assembly protein [Paenibacillus foliorum]